MEEFSFEVVRPEEYEEALSLFWLHFMPDEPCTRLVGCCTLPGYRIYNLDTMLRGMLTDNTCWMARSSSGEMAGVIFCSMDRREEGTGENPTGEEYLEQGWPEDFTKILILLDQLCNHQQLMAEKGAGSMLDLFGLVVGANFRGQGLAAKLISKALSEGRSKGIPLATITCSSSFSQRCARKLGFSQEKAIQYKDWAIDGRHVAREEDIDPMHPSVVSFSMLL